MTTKADRDKVAAEPCACVWCSWCTNTRRWADGPPESCEECQGTGIVKVCDRCRLLADMMAAAEAATSNPCVIHGNAWCTCERRDPTKEQAKATALADRLLARIREQTGTCPRCKRGVVFCNCGAKRSHGGRKGS